MSQSPIKYVSIMFSSPVRILRIIYICTHRETYIGNFVFSFFFLNKNKNKNTSASLPPSLRLPFTSPSFHRLFFFFIIILYFIFYFIYIYYPFFGTFFFFEATKEREKKKKIYNFISSNFYFSFSILYLCSLSR